MGQREYYLNSACQVHFSVGILIVTVSWWRSFRVSKNLNAMPSEVRSPGRTTQGVKASGKGPDYVRSDASQVGGHGDVSMHENKSALRCKLSSRTYKSSPILPQPMVSAEVYVPWRCAMEWGSMDYFKQFAAIFLVLNITTRCEV